MERVGDGVGRLVDLVVLGLGGLRVVLPLRELGKRLTLGKAAESPGAALLRLLHDDGGDADGSLRLD